MFIFDAHLDLSMNALEWNRDLRLTVTQIREGERNLDDKPDRGMSTVSLPAMRRGNVGLCVATQIARYVKPENPLPGWNSPQQAWAQTQGQLAWYRAMEEEGEMVQISSADQLEQHLVSWNTRQAHSYPIGYILSLEGADSIIDLSYLQKAHAYGLRAIGPAHYGPGTYAFGTHSDGGIGEKGKELLLEMEKLGIILDVTHLCDRSFWEALDSFGGALWSSHSNCRSLVPHGRQFSDEQIKELISREAVLGVALDAWMLIPGWIKGRSRPAEMKLKLHHMVNHLDHICQLAGDSLHAGIGTDLDGGFGREQCPADLDTIADLQRLPQLLHKKGYTDEDIANITHNNFINFLFKAWK